VAWSPDGKYIASGGDDRTVRVWDASTGKDIYIYRKHNDIVLSVAWSPDSKRIVSGGDDKLAPGRDDRRTVQIWDAMNGENVISCGRHASRVYAVTWSPDGKYIASNEVHGVQVWDTATGDPVTAYHAHLNIEVFELLQVSWSPDGTRLAVSDQDGKILVGSVDLPDVPT
jgi:WD40 repeat protein